MMKRGALRILLCAALLGLFCLTAGAATDTVVASGSCGENVTYTLYSDRELVIAGTGAMTEWEDSSQIPWYAYRDSIRAANIGDGVTTIGDYAFQWCITMES